MQLPTYQPPTATLRLMPLTAKEEVTCTHIVRAYLTARMHAHYGADLQRAPADEGARQHESCMSHDSMSRCPGRRARGAAGWAARALRLHLSGWVRWRHVADQARGRSRCSCGAACMHAYHDRPGGGQARQATRIPQTVQVRDVWDARILCRSATDQHIIIVRHVRGKSVHGKCRRWSCGGCRHSVCMHACSPTPPATSRAVSS